MDDSAKALVRVGGGVAEPTAVGLLANPNVPSGSGTGTVALLLLPLPLSLPPLSLALFKAPGQKGGHGSATPRDSDRGPLASYNSAYPFAETEVLTVSVTYPQSAVEDAEAGVHVVFVGGVTRAIHTPSSETAILEHIPKPRVAVVPARKAV